MQHSISAHIIGIIAVAIARHTIKVSNEHEGKVVAAKLWNMPNQAAHEPLPVLELVARDWITVRYVDIAYAYTTHDTLNVSCLRLQRIARGVRETHYKLGNRVSGKNCHSVIAFLPRNSDMVPALLEVRRREVVIRALGLLQRQHVGPVVFDVLENVREPLADRIHIPGCNR